MLASILVVGEGGYERTLMQVLLLLGNSKADVYGNGTVTSEYNHSVKWQLQLESVDVVRWIMRGVVMKVAGL